ncbi:MAG: transcription termination/antitermination NusG family protein [Anaerolineales bacterium]|jgi:transcriptional antiterminator RfaH
MNAEWYAFRAKPHKERALYKQVIARNIECFFPIVRVNPVNPRAAKTRPYFPGYLFVKVDIDKVGISTFKWMPFGMGLVCFDSEPASIPPSLIVALKKRVQEIMDKGGLKFDTLQEGVPIRVMDGPFRGYEGIFDKYLDGSERVKVLLQFMCDRHVPIEMHMNQIAATNQA